MEKAEVEKTIHKRIEKDPGSLIPAKSLKELGFSRHVCRVCGKHFWSTVDIDTCGDVDCIGDYTFLDERLTPMKVPYRIMWDRFSAMFRDFGHKEIKRYPVAARWRDDIYFVEAAIDDFAPYVINGMAEPPANPLVVPQICLRFNDVGNVGLTGRHLTSFIMAEEAAFNSKKKKTYFDKEAIKYIYRWLKDGLKIDTNKLTFVEDSWAGAGYAGSCLEFFAGGLELGNQVYMRYSITSKGLEDMDTKTIDMGAGLERWAWVSMGTPTVYEAVFPKVIDFIKRKTGVNYSDDVLRKVYKFAGKIDYENTPFDEAVKILSEKSGLDTRELTKILTDMQAVYSIADHTRTLLVSVHDGVLPSNVGGGYNLRNILRRCLNFIESKGWDLDLNDVIEEHKKEFGSWFKELNDFDISSIINKEKDRYAEFKSRNAKTILGLIDKRRISSEVMSELYESKGITPEDIKYIADREGKRVDLPERIYSNANKRKENREAAKTYDLSRLKPTEKLFYREDLLKIRSKIVKKIDGNKIVLDKTIFYPEMGGQKPDGGNIDDIKVIDVRITEGVIIHTLEKPLKKDAGELVSLEVDAERRELLKKHHTATHIINQAARRILGKFVYQNGAEKDVDKAHLDITYFDKLTDLQVIEIESMANDVVAKDLTIKAKKMGRTEAEKRYGMEIYQGGAIPSAEIRVVSIDEYDVEACGGLHCNRTGEVGLIKITKTERIQDGIVRLNYVAYKAAMRYIEVLDKQLKDISAMWGVNTTEVYNTAKRFFLEAKHYKEAYENSESARVISDIKGAKESKIVIKTSLENAGQLIKELLSLPHDGKTIVIQSKDFGIGVPKNDEAKNELSKVYLAVIDKEKFWIAHN